MMTDDKLRRERDRYRWMLDRALEPVIVADARGALEYANCRARQIFGLADGSGEDVADALSRRFQCEPAGALAAWRELRWPLDRKFVLFEPETPQMAARWFQVELQPMGADGETLLRFTNRSGWVRRELETFTFQHLIAHKIRTPMSGLGPILTYLDAMEHAGTDPEMSSLLQTARQSAEHLEDTLYGVLRYHSAVFAPPMAPDVNAVRGSLVEILARAASASGLEGRIVLTDPEIEVAHPEMIEIVMTEILDNYAKYGRAKEEGVRVSYDLAHANGAEVCFAAPGPDLPDELLAQVGSSYWQLERLSSGEVPGLGLGLAAARQLVRWWGGDLRLARSADGIGLETRMLLPACVLD
ncbi:PAS domain-containing sensor histidine kinase [Opitutus sp. ER46]|uniref:sensor histidine kinase n=1 Tax=Opitutus sp. ER46 TaxID=2161864 RepID=UPI000D30DB15|nr:PAS domain-containing sensor histidine kinase [Opitutus sp. ER46]PTY00360.1 hypothetical protein DB354_01760 [Opitutus sp. ER46]